MNETQNIHNTVQGPASLAVTFYCVPQRAQELIDCLIDCLRETPFPFSEHQKENAQLEVWHTGGDTPVALLYLAHSHTIQDTTRVELYINQFTPGDATSAWFAMLEKVEQQHTGLRQLLEDQALTDEKDRAVRSYTITFCHHVKITETELAPFLKAVRPLYSQRPAYDHYLAKYDQPESIWYLVDIPNRGHGTEAAMIYLATGSDEAVSQVLTQYQFINLIAHKGYHQMRQYRLSILERKYKDLMKILRKTTGDILKQAEYTGLSMDNLNEITFLYDDPLSDLPYLEALNISLKRQVYNYRSYQDRLENKHDDIVQFHREHVEAHAEELELLVTEIKSVLDTIRVALDIVQTRLEKEQHTRQHQINLWLAAIAIILSVPQLIDRDVVMAVPFLIDCLRSVPVPVPILAPDTTHCSTLSAFFVQILVLLIILLSWLILSLWDKKTKQPRLPRRKP